MDAITAAIVSMNVPALTELSTIIDGSLAFVVIIALLLFFFEPRQDKRVKVIIVAALAALMAMGVKEIMQVPRPCHTFDAKVACPADYSFPSMHAAVAFAVMLAFINKPTFPIYFLFAIFVAFSRIYLGVHTFEDIAGGLVMAPIAYQTVEILWRKKK